MRDGCLEGATIVSRLPAAFPPPTFASRSSDARRGVQLSSRSAYRPEGRTSTGLRFPHARAAAGVGASYTPRTAVLLPAEGRARPAPAASQRPVLTSSPTTSHRRGPLHEASVGGLGSSPVRPAPRLWPPDGSGALGLPLELRTPPLPAAHVEGGARSLEHGPGTMTACSAGPASRCMARPGSTTGRRRPVRGRRSATATTG